MFCQKCGKEIPDGAKFCSFCGAPSPEPSPRHAKPDPEELYSYSDEQIHDEDATRVFDPEQGVDEPTRVYNFENFEDNGQGFGVPYDQGGMYPNEPEPLNDSYENYQDGLDDDTFMDRMDNKFRRDDYDDYDEHGRPPKKKSKAWLWITLGIVAVVLIIVFAVLAFSGNLFGNKKAAPTVAPTAATVAKATTAPKPTKAPETQAPETQAPATEPPATQPPATEAPEPITEAPKTEAPATEAPVTEPPETEPPVTEAPEAP